MPALVLVADGKETVLFPGTTESRTSFEPEGWERQAGLVHSTDPAFALVYARLHERLWGLARPD